MDTSAVAELLTAMATILVPAGAALAFWLNRPQARLERALNLAKELPAGTERDAWERIALDESRALRGRRDLRAQSDIRRGITVLVLSVAGIAFTVLNAVVNGVTVEVLLLIGFALGIYLSVVMIKTGRARRRAIEHHLTAQQ